MVEWREPWAYFDRTIASEIERCARRGHSVAPWPIAENATRGKRPASSDRSGLASAAPGPTAFPVPEMDPPGPLGRFHWLSLMEATSYNLPSERSRLTSLARAEHGRGLPWEMRSNPTYLAGQDPSEHAWIVRSRTYQVWEGRLRADRIAAFGRPESGDCDTLVTPAVFDARSRP